MTFGSLFAGIGGMDLGLERAGMTCKWQVEIDSYARRVLAKHWPDVRRHDDVRTFPPSAPEEWRVDCIAGGFPCIDISSSGKKEGVNGEHSGLWSEFSRIIRRLRPSIVLMENVADIAYRGLGDVLGALAEIGLDAEWQVLPGAAFGSPQRRERMFIVAYADCFRRKGSKERDSQRTVFERWDYDDGLALAERRARDAQSWVSRANDGVSDRVHRLRCLGNSVVPQVAEWIGRRIMESVKGIP